MLERMESAGVKVVRYRPLQYNLGRMNNADRKMGGSMAGRLTAGSGRAWTARQDPDHGREAHLSSKARWRDAGRSQRNWIKTSGDCSGQDYSALAPAANGAHVIAAPAQREMHMMY